MEGTSKRRSAAARTLKYKVAYSEKLGRHLQAAKDLKQGEVVFREEPIVVGPITCNRYPVCFACMRILPPIEEEDEYTCSKCTIAPLCGVACDEQPGHHTPDECKIFEANKDLLREHMNSVTRVLFILRLWLLKKRDPKLWERVEIMEAHLDERRGAEEWQDRETNIVNKMQSLKLVPDNDPSVSELLQLMCGIVDVNSLELRPPGRIEGLYLRGLFVEASLLSHNCRSNLHLTANSDFNLIVYASVPIKEGDVISFNYSSPVLGTLSRRYHLKKTKYFECDCTVCSDPYEMGSYLSSILCPQCKEGYVGLENPLAKFPYAKETKWKCNKCEHRIGGCLVKTTLSLCKSLLEEVDCDDAKELDIVRRKLLNSLHRNHFLMLAVKQKLLAIYRFEAVKPNPRKKLMENMLLICREMCELLEIVEPGISRYKAILLYELHLPIVSLANYAHSREEITPTELGLRLEEAATVLKKSLNMLLLEPTDTPEGKLAKRALQKLKALNVTITDIKALSQLQRLTIRERIKLQRSK